MTSIGFTRAILGNSHFQTFIFAFLEPLDQRAFNMTQRVQDYSRRVSFFETVLQENQRIVCFRKGKEQSSLVNRICKPFERIQESVYVATIDVKEEWKKVSVIYFDRSPGLFQEPELIAFSLSHKNCQQLVKKMWQEGQVSKMPAVLEVSKRQDRVEQPSIHTSRLVLYTDAIMELVREGSTEKALSAFMTLNSLLEKKNLKSLIYQLVDEGQHNLAFRFIKNGDETLQSIAFPILIDRVLKYGLFVEAQELALQVGAEMTHLVHEANRFYFDQFEKRITEGKIASGINYLTHMQLQNKSPQSIPLAYNWLAQYAAAAGYFSNQDGALHCNLVIYELGLERIGKKHPEFRKPKHFRQEIDLAYASYLEKKSTPITLESFDQFRSISDKSAFLLGYIERLLEEGQFVPARGLSKRIPLPFYRMLAKRKIKQRVEETDIW